MNIINLTDKIKKNLNNNIKTYKYNKKHFSGKIARGVLKSMLISVLPFKNRNKYYYEQDKLIYDCLSSKYRYLIDKYNNNDDMIDEINKKYIWVFWYQGIDSAPLIVKKCINSIKKHCLDYEVVILNKDNIHKYIDIPQIILDKVDKKIITLTHFSDILRMGLLSKHGGIWVDSTCYITSDVFKKFDNKIFNSNCINNSKWCGFFIGGMPNKVFKFTYEFLIDYNSKEDCLINYFLIEYILRICNGEVNGCDKIINSSDITNSEIHCLNNAFNDEYESENYRKIILSSDFFKLTYKVKFKKQINNKLTNYGYFMETK